jgi:hypothetical protein
MRGLILIAGTALAVGLAFVGWHFASRFSTDTFSEAKTTTPEAMPLCPWRQPEADLKAFFPEATGYRAETRILSGLRLELAERLGRTPTGDENALRLYRVYRDTAPVGTILTRRAKGSYGAIELVLATDTNRIVRAMRLQRLREPESIAGVLQDARWQSSFVGKTSQDVCQVGRDIGSVPTEALNSAQAVSDGIRSLLVLLSASEQTPPPRLADAHHN